MGSTAGPSQASFRPPEMDGITVAVPTRDRKELALAALAAIAPQLGPEDQLLLVDNGSEDGTGDAAAQYLAAVPAGRVVFEPEGGISAARNRAIAEARHPIVCFVDDDVRVEAGWLDAVHNAWADAGPRVACVGGPLRPAWGAERPPWLADYLLYVLSVLDLGGERRPLDQSPGRGYAWGGNFSLRVAPVLAVGGFDPERGLRPSSPTDRGEEEELQRRLAAAGYEVWYEPRAVARHLIPERRLTESFFTDAFRARGQADASNGAGRVQALGILGRGAARYAVLRVRRNPLAPTAKFTCAYAWARLQGGARIRRHVPPPTAL